MSETRQEFLNEVDKLECHILAEGLDHSKKRFKNTCNLNRNTVTKGIAVIHQKTVSMPQYHPIISPHPHQIFEL